MNRVRNILLRVRDTLGDHNQQRWSDERLLRILDEAQQDVCRRAKLLRTRINYVITDGVAEYKMPDDFLLLDKVNVNNVRVGLIGHTELDRSVSGWLEHTGKTKYIVYDKQERGKIRIYPIPDFDNSSKFIPVPAYQSYRYGFISDKFGCITNSVPSVEYPDGIYGFTHSIHGVWQFLEDGMPKLINHEFFTNGLYGIVSDISLPQTPEVPLSSDGGEITDISSIANSENFGIITGFELGKDFDLVTGDNCGIYFGANGAYFSAFEKLGEISNIENYDGDFFGFISGFNGEILENIDFDSLYGVTTSLETKENVMEVYYIRKPKEINSLDSEIEIDSSLDKALKYYVVAMAFRDDLDTQNRNMAKDELELYERELKQAYLDDSTDFTRNESAQYETKYNALGF